MSLRSRLQQLERRQRAPGVCPVCHFRPDDIRTLAVVLPFGSEPGPPSTAPPRERCPRCGGWMPPVRIVKTVAQEPRKPGTPRYEIVHEADRDR